MVWWWRRPSRSTTFATLAAASAGSLVLSLWLTHANEPVAFFSLPTRAWELGLGGLIALGAPELKRTPGSRVAAALGWAGLARHRGGVRGLRRQHPVSGHGRSAPRARRRRRGGVRTGPSGEPARSCSWAGW